MEPTTVEALMTGPLFNKWRDNWIRRDGIEGSTQRGRRRSRGRSAYTPNTTEENWRGNPLDYQGKPTRCRICDSTYHYVRACPEKRPRRVFEVDSTREFNPGDPLVTGEDDCQVFKVNVGGLMAESFSCAILDSACTTTVCGKDWPECYLDLLEENMLAPKEDCHNDINDDAEFDDVSVESGVDVSDQKEIHTVMNGNGTKAVKAIPKVGNKVKYLPIGSDTWRKASILSRAGKATEIHKYRLNIKDEDGKAKSIDIMSGVQT
ncbi:hypothetical protein Pcinc_032015 [Petrolisthes cinctipes]|uniref:Uncharacterized protein n=1 Tax=Petrolisthes cinctipes TaxID=88211 RepID=A0AAE1K259_PETCI|nr:hypothetical protein Pcinc_032015 [Petrolisthes cinctipes]